MDELNRGRDGRIETQWELLTRAALGHEATVACRAGTGGDEPAAQYALVGNEQQHCCVRDETVTLFCDVEGEFQPTSASARWIMTPAADRAGVAPTAETDDTDENDGGAGSSAPAPPPGADARIDGTRLAFDVACCAVRCGPLASSGLELLLEATGTVANADTVDWRDDWSTETGEIGRTLQLQGFVDAVRIRPDRYRLETPPILRFPGR